MNSKQDFSSLAKRFEPKANVPKYIFTSSQVSLTYNEVTLTMSKVSFLLKQAKQISC